MIWHATSFALQMINVPVLTLDAYFCTIEYTEESSRIGGVAERLQMRSLYFLDQDIKLTAIVKSLSFGVDCTPEILRPGHRCKCWAAAQSAKIKAEVHHSHGPSKIWATEDFGTEELSSLVQLYPDCILGLPKGASSHTHNTPLHAIPVLWGQCTCPASISFSNGSVCYGFQCAKMHFTVFNESRMDCGLCWRLNREEL